MQPRRRLVTSLGSVFMLVLVVSTWLVFAPTQLGGHTSYVIINGNSMEPGMHRGDLAIVREAPAYREGDVVTYRHPDIGNVIHRIIGRDGERYLFQGDHNDFIDAYHPARADLVGKLWFRVPGVGTWLSRFRSPVYAAGLLFVAFVGLGGGAVAAQQHRRRRDGRRAPQATPGRTPMQPLSKNWQDVLSVIGALGLGFAVLAFVAFKNPQTRTVPDELGYEQSGSFEYSAAAADGSVYDSGAATTGEPVYRRLSDAVALTFTYELASTSGIPATARGEYRFLAEVSDGSGWKRTLDLGSGSFERVPFTVAGTLNLAEAQAHITTLEAQTGVKNQSYTVTIAPQVQATGSIAGKPVREQFAPELKFTMDAFALKLAPMTGEAGNPLAPSKDGLVQGQRAEANTIGLPLFDLRVESARWISVGGLGVVLCVAGLYLVLLVRVSGPIQGRPEMVAAKLGGSLVRVSGVPVARARTIDVATVDDLAKIAQKEGCVILQEARPGYHAYFIHLGDITYRHQALGQPKGEARASARPGNAA